MTPIEPPLTASTAVIDGLFQALPGIAYVIDEVGRFVRWNREYMQLLGLEESDFCNLEALDLVAEKDRARAAAAMREALDGRKVSLECSLCWREREVPVYGTVVRVEMDGRFFLVGTAFDVSEVRATEAALARSERKFREIFNATDDIIGIHAEDGRFTDVNDQFCALFQCRREDVIGRTAQFLEYSTAPYSERDALDRMRLAWQGEHQLFEWPCRRANGETFWTEVSLRRAEIGGESRIIACVRDISERKRTEVALRASENKFRQLFDGAADAIYLADQSGRFVDVNRAASQSSGFSREELLGMSIFDIDVDAQPTEMTHLWEAISRGSRIEGERRHRHRDSSLQPVDVRASAFHDGQQLLIAAAVRSLAARRQSEREIAEWKQRYDLLTRAAGQIVYDRDASGSIVWGGAVSKTLGYSAEGLPGTFTDFIAIVAPEDRDRVRIAFESSELHRREYNVEYRLLHQSGRNVLVLDRGYPQFDEAGELVRFVGVLSDITETRIAEVERRHLEESLRQAQKMESIGRLAGGVAHDFNNLLTAISGNLHLAMLDAMLDTETRELLNEATRAAESAASLTRQLLTFSRKQLISPAVLSVNDVVRRLEKMLRRLLGEDIDLVVRLHPELFPVYSDVGQLEQVLVNLAVNARDAMPSGGRLLVQTENLDVDEAFCRTLGQLQPGPYVRLTIEDNGVGMSPDTQEHLFEPFFTTKDLGKGTGLGLAMVYGAVQQNRGHIAVRSGVGAGTTIRVYFPAASGPTKSLTTSDSPALAAGAETILLVEDEEQVRALAVRILCRQGYRVHAFGNGEDALLALAGMDDPVHLLVTDVVMPGINGRELADRAQRLRTGLSVLFTSGYTEDAIAHHGVLDAGIEFLPKPYSVTSLLQRVRKVLDAGQVPGEQRESVENVSR